MTIKPAAHIATAIEDTPEIQAANPIHDGDVAAQYGYAGAIVAGVSTYGWAVPAILESLGEDWLSHGWAELAFRRPVFVDDRLTTRVQPSADGSHGILEQTGPDGRVTIAGLVGLGDAPWKDEFVLPVRRTAVPAIEAPPVMDLGQVPTDEDYRPMRVDIGKDENVSWCIERLAERHPRWHRGEHPIVHPSWCVGQMTPLIYHSYDFPAGIHATGRIQHLALHRCGGPVTVAGRWRGKEMRKGKLWSTTDAVFLSDQGIELSYVRQVAVILPPPLQ